MSGGRRTTARRCAFLALTLGSAACETPAVVTADTVYVNGTVVTVDAANASTEATAVAGDVIVAVGSNDEIERLVGPATQVVDLNGRVLVPGFYAPHDHFPGAGVNAIASINLNSPPMGPMETIDDIVEALRQRAEVTPPGEWIRGAGYDDTLLREGRHPTREDLDRASVEHPIFLDHTSLHFAVANSLALELAGVTRDTPQPAGGAIRKDPDTGEPNGVFEEVGGMVSRLIPPLSPEEVTEGYRTAVDIYLRQGVTTTVVAAGGPGSMAALQAAQDAGILSLRVILMAFRASPESRSAIESGSGPPESGDDRLRWGAVKIIHDGSNQGFTGYFTEPYYTPFQGDPDWRGYPRRSRADLATMVSDLHVAGYQIAVHGNGDAAIDDILYAYREAQRQLPRPDARHRIEHAQMARQDQLDEMRELGVTPSFFVGHVYYWGDRHRDIFMGPERAAAISPLRSARDRGIRFTVHDDTPVTPVDPLQLVWVAANRLTRSNRVLGPEERISPFEALRAITIDAAWQNFEEDIKGSIEAGKLADLVILSDNPLTVDPTTIREIEVLETIVGGRTVFRR